MKTSREVQLRTMIPCIASRPGMKGCSDLVYILTKLHQLSSLGTVQNVRKIDFLLTFLTSNRLEWN